MGIVAVNIADIAHRQKVQLRVAYTALEDVRDRKQHRCLLLALP